MPENFQLPSPLQKIENTLTQEHKINLYIKRDDMIHPHISGNKWRKLKYHFEDARKHNKNTILTAGGAYSNHITATAAACHAIGFKSIGIIRGEELNANSNPSLQFAAIHNMELFFIDRALYSKRHEPDFLKTIIDKFLLPEEEIYCVPEGGATVLGAKGCAEIVKEIETDFDYICCPCGTGTTLGGIAGSLKYHQKSIGIVVLNHTNMESEIKNKYTINSELITFNYPFGGYARTTPELIQFIKDFYSEQNILLDYVYTGKMMYGIYDLIRQNYFPENSTVIAVHTGGVMNANVLEIP